MQFLKNYQINFNIEQPETQRAVWLLIVFIYVLLRIQPTGIPIDRDEGVFGLIGRSILEGGMPYRDALDHKPPLVFIVYAFAQLIFPPNALGIHTFLHIYNFITLLVLFKLTKKLADIESAYWVALLFSVFSINPAIQGFTASVEMFMLLPFSLSIYFVVKAFDSQNVNYRNLALSGIFAAAACWFKQPVVFSLLFCLVVMGYLLWKRISVEDRVATITKAILIWLSSGILFSAIILGFFALNNLLGEFLYWSFEHSLLYSLSTSVTEKTTRSIYGLLNVITNNLHIVLLSITSLFANCKKILIPLPLLLVFVLLSIVGTSIGFGYAHYYAQLVPSLVVLTGISISFFLKNISSSQIKSVLSVVIGMVVLFGEIVQNYDYHFSGDPETFSREYHGINPFRESILIAKYLKENTDPKDSIFIYGSEPQILLLAERPSATAFFVIYPLMSSQYPRYIEFQKRVIEEVKLAKPAYIVSVLLPESLMYDGKSKILTAFFIPEYLSKYYKLENMLFYNKEKKRWVSYNQSDEKISEDAILIHKRIKNSN